jgi:flagellar biosynthesis protein FlhG
MTRFGSGGWSGGAPVADATAHVDQASRLRALLAGARPSPRPDPTHARRPAPPQPPGPARVIAIASGKGGVGKTTLGVNLSIALASHSMRTTLLDADLGTANADLLCGLSPRRRLDAWLTLAREHRAPLIRDLIMEAPGGFRLVPGAVGIALAGELDAPARLALAEAIDALDSLSDAVVVDAAAGVGRQVLSVVAMADVTIIVTTPEPPAIADAYALIKCAVAERRAIRSDSSRSLTRGIGPRDARLALVVNQAREMREALDVHRRITNVAERFLDTRIPLLGVVAEDPGVGAAVRAKRPLLLMPGRHPAARDLRAIGDRLAQLLRPAPSSPAPARRLSDLVGAHRRRWSTNVRHQNR